MPDGSSRGQRGRARSPWEHSPAPVSHPIHQSSIYLSLSLPTQILTDSQKPRHACGEGTLAVIQLRCHLIQSRCSFLCCLLLSATLWGLLRVIPKKAHACLHYLAAKSLLIYNPEPVKATVRISYIQNLAPKWLAEWPLLPQEGQKRFYESPASPGEYWQHVVFPYTSLMAFDLAFKLVSPKALMLEVELLLISTHHL